MKILKQRPWEPAMSLRDITNHFPEKKPVMIQKGLRNQEEIIQKLIIPMIRITNMSTKTVTDQISTKSQITDWIQLQKGIAMGCSISPILFELSWCLNIIDHSFSHFSHCSPWRNGGSFQKRTQFIECTFLLRQSFACVSWFCQFAFFGYCPFYWHSCFLRYFAKMKISMKLWWWITTTLIGITRILYHLPLPFFLSLLRFLQLWLKLSNNICQTT